jgi:tRNA pseudouridine32 synthase/23S rRNA pseudouridine746 synthase
MPIEASPADTSICVVYADDAIVVLDKPAALLSVPGRGPDKQDCLSTRVQGQYADALVVHRLDMATSGLIVMARGAARSPGPGYRGRSPVPQCEPSGRQT